MGLKSLDAGHQTGNLKIDVGKEKAVAFCFGTATHYKNISSGNNTRTFVGRYNFHHSKYLMNGK